MTQSKSTMLVFDHQLIAEKEYWLERLQGELERSSLLPDHPTSLNGDRDVHETSSVLADDIYRKLTAITGDSPFLLYTALLTTIQVCLHKYTGNTTIVTGSPARRRGDHTGEHTNVLAIVSEMSAANSFRELLLGTRQALLDAYALQRYPFERIVRDLNLDVLPHRCPLFDVIASLEGFHDELPALNYDIAMHFRQHAEAIAIRVAFDANLFLPETIERFIGHYQHILARALDDVQTPLSQLTLVTEPERQQLLSDWNVCEMAYPSDQSLPELFEAQAMRTPDAKAVTFNGEDLTYRDLNQRANQLAHHLGALGIGPESTVGICVACSLDMIVGILGILKAGGAYVPLDPGYPPERITWIMEDADATVLLTQDKQLASLPSLRATVVCLDRDWPKIATNSEIDPRVAISPTTLAYVIYTSGSTGQPKGVMAEHQNVVNLVYSLQQSVYFRYANPLRVALISPYIFDASVPQIFAVLLLGHHLFVVPEDKRFDGGSVLAFYRDNQIDISDGTPNLLRLLTACLYETDAALSVRQFLIGGEALGGALLASFYAAFKAQPPLVTNVYGPAECCGESTTYDADAATISGLTNIPIGKPLANERVYILDAANHLQPIGVPGEICIGGDGVTRGYLGRDDLTRERYIDNPFRPGTRLYRSGDLGRYRPDGNLEFIARIDNQVKIRGCRVEPGEIEHVLKEFNKTTKSKLIHHQTFSKASKSKTSIRCTRCLLSSNYPEIAFNSDGVCNICTWFATYRDHVQKYFSPKFDFDQLIEQAKKANRGSDYDCMLLFSGGKDSSYVLYRLIERGLRVLAFTFDNGFISRTAFDNIERTTTRLGVESIISTVNNMNEIFVASLNHDSTVCGGCFKALTTLSTQIAHDRGINMVITGLSRGQIVETKLKGLFREHIFESGEIEDKLLLFRKIYHSNEDRLAKLLDTDLSQVPFDDIHWVDYFRYDDTPVCDLKDYLSAKDPYWSEPQDTGFCSSNCQINDIGIYVHQENQGYHNYEAPLSWDVRLGLVDREEALAQLKYDFRAARVNKVLNTIGYFNKRIKDALVVTRKDGQDHEVLCAYFIANQNINTSELRAYLAEKLPDYMIPSHFIRVPEFPLTRNGKLDYGALPEPGRPELESEFRPPSTDIEKQLASIWAEALGHERVGIYDNFFDLGGHSLLMTQVHSIIRDTFRVDLSVVDLFRYPTISVLADHIQQQETDEADPLQQVQERSRRQRAALARQREVMQQSRKAQ